jgi:hypothetical protein
MNYNFTIIDACDECRLTLLKNNAIMAKFKVVELGDGSINNCKICGKLNRYTRSVLTNYHVPAEISEKDQVSETPRSVEAGFKLLWIEDEIERNR